MKSKFRIRGLDCANCASELEREIKKIYGVKSVSISFMSERMEIEYDDSKKNEIIDKLEKVIKREEPDVEIKEL